ncbi:ribosome biogenesis GTP-binding protein YihA/YsxC [Sediminicurvatus halobius]|uniref:Probable GTP-binding protein EngB n=1 Tax=Sediminicurvatus halobius TaxID=2182432 RepID=A0A2U2N9W8_9GAMM|nr:YihA family ribosome biogenesis GTP-binding protein [Spiribacter halobius]
MIASGLDYRSTRFLMSAPNPEQLPPDEGAEAAFAGRSNAGKSSALNALTDQRQLARISKTPGRTQQINVFPVTDHQRLIDLPGYGYAKAPAALRAHWQQTLPRYLETRRSLRGLVLIMDIRHPLTDSDRQMLAWCAAAGLPAHILLNKADKLRRGPAGNALQKVRATLAREFPGTSVQLFSSTVPMGVDEARARLDDWLAG